MVFYYLCKVMEKTYSETTTLRTLRDTMLARLKPVYGSREAAWMVRAIIEEVTGRSHVDVLLSLDKPVGTARQGAAMAMVECLLAHEPLQYILGYTTFMGLRIIVAPGVLIPRPETEELTQIIIDREGTSTPDLRVLDACTGSGCIACAMARNLLFPEITATDISADALKIAAENVKALKVNVDLVKADMLDNPRLPGEPFDIIVSNPPYVMQSERKDMDANVLDHEPETALFVPDTDPLEFYDAITAYSADALKPGGRLYFECNPLNIAMLKGRFDALGWEAETLRDTSGKLRFITARKPMP